LGRMAALRSAWVCGGSRGLGLGLAAGVLARGGAGARVWISGRDLGQDAAPGLAALRERWGDQVALVPLDATDPVAVEDAARRVADESGGALDALICTIGVLHRDGRQPEKRLRDFDPEWAIESFRVNAVAPMLLARAAIEHDLFDREQWTVIANLSAKIGSVSDNRLGSWYSYRASKAAQNQLNRCIAIELARMRRKTICVGLHPGTVDTQLSQPFSKNVSYEVFTVEKASEQLLNVLAGLDPATHNGKLLSYSGDVIDP